MKVFVTGGTGLVGSAVVAELLAHGHEVEVLARSEASAGAVERAGATPVRGALADLDVVRAGVERAEGVVNLAFNHDFGTPDGWERSVAEEGAALATIGEVLAGSDRPFVTTSGTPWVTGRASTEDDPILLEGPTAGRARAVTAVLGLASRGVRSSSVRLPRTVHNEGRGGFAGMVTDFARRTGIAGYLGDGTQRWPAVHALDAAVLFRLALERAPAGTAWHAVGEEGVSVLDMTAVIGRRLGLPVESVPQETFGPLGPIFAMDQPSTAVKTREFFGWEPTHPDLLADLELVEK